MKIGGWKTILSFWGKRPICRGEPVSFRQGSAKWGKTHPQSRCGVEVGYVDFWIPSVIRKYPAGAIWWVYSGEITCLQLGGRDLPVVEIRHVLWMARIQAWPSSWTPFFSHGCVIFFGGNRCVCVVRFFLVYFPKRICCGVVGLSFVLFFSKQQILRRELIHAEKKLPQEKVFSPKVRFQYSTKYDLKDLISVSLKLFLPPWSLEFFSNLFWWENTGSNMKRVQICPTKIQRPW